MPLYRHQKDGEYIETVEQYKARIERCSDEYHMVKEVANYLETKVLNKVLFKNISNNYEDSALLRHFNTSALVEGANVIIYDTLKNAPTSNRGSDIGSWSQLVNTATMLQETTAKLKDVTSIMSFQLDREAYKKRIEELSESNIAGASGIMHVADSMVMFLHIAKEDYKDYRILKQCDEWGRGETIEVELDPKKNYSAFRVMKTRNNSKGTIYVTETDLNRNTWDEIPGELIVKNSRSMNWKK
jgi:predicted ATP-dependent serine protease